MRLWLRHSSDSWQRLPVPHDSPHVHTVGSDADRVLIAGDGAATGRGVVTHDLGLPGYLARAVSERTRRATDVDIVVAGDMTAAACLESIANLELSRFDCVLLAVGGVEALAFTPIEAWERDLGALLDRIDADAAPSTGTSLLSIPLFEPRHLLPRFLARAVNRRVRLINDATRRVLADRRDVHLITVGHTEVLESSGAHTYAVWAASVAPHLAAQLPHGDEERRSRREEHTNEAARQAAVDRLGALASRGDPVLDVLTARARGLFGTAYAAVTIIDDDTQKSASTAGATDLAMPRSESFCEMTIRRAEHFAVEDATLDPRYRDFRSVTGDPHFRFYAGYPIESIDGERVGALCVIDTAAREFTRDDSALLRSLALQAQERVQELSEPLDP
ncbi:GAF domain-containing protein [Marisediminicola sp. LYQ85]|uniref:GAF domain-containing protein n=1 Tax=Marisediminicola sp. LYQ85 TaxID=3391062 RepID=UPI003983C49A